MSRRFLIILLCLYAGGPSRAQTLDGYSVYSFLRIAPSSQLSALGGINVSHQSEDASLSWYQPAGIRSIHDHQLSLSFNAFLAASAQVSALYVHPVESWKTRFAAGIVYMDYGTLDQTDVNGNILGTFRPRDYALQVSANRLYLQRWYYGVTLRFVSSDYGLYRSSALMADVGIQYSDSSGGWSAGLVARNMGVQLRTYSGKEEDLPFDLQLGVSRKFREWPLQISLTTQRLHQFDLAYEDPSDPSLSYGDGFFNNLFRHVLLSMQWTLARRIELTAGYNHLRRSELNLDNGANGFNGFSLGAGVLFPRWNFRYARAYYQSARAYNQIALGIRFR